MRYFSTFSGIGGFEYGIQRAFDRSASGRQGQAVHELDKTMPNTSGERTEQSACIGYSEIDKYATKVYERHFNGHKNYGDITQIKAEELPDFDCLVGGFPCQAFSIAGKRRGFDDTRGTLFFDLARILRAKQPRLFVFENVKGLLSHDNGNTFRTIIATIDELGYDCQWQVLNSKNHGVPQNRERIIIVGHLRGTPRPEVFPITTSNGTHIEVRNEDKNTEASVPDSTDWYGAESERPDIRRLTPKECERLQGFPDNWTALGINDEPISDTQRYKMCGNAVTTNVIQAVFERIFA